VAKKNTEEVKVAKKNQEERVKDVIKQNESKFGIYNYLYFFVCCFIYFWLICQLCLKHQ